MQITLLRKGIAFTVILLSIGMSIIPSTSTIVEKKFNILTFNDGSLLGYVNDTSMNPMEGARIRVYFHGTYEEDNSDSSGYYHLDNIPICNCTKNCTAFKEGYNSECVWLSIYKNTTYDFVLTHGNTLYVGGDGPGNYTRIQDAIDDASDGDTVFVYNGTYFENIDITKGELTLIGEDKNTTIIDGGGSGDVMYIFADYVNVTGFTVQNSGDEDFDAGIEVRSDYNTIYGNLIHDNGGNDYNDQGGIYLNSSSHNEISNNIIYQNDRDGIFMVYSDYNHIHDNEIYDNWFIAMIISDSSYNTIENNDMYENFCCMSFWPYSTHNTIQRNYIHDHPGCGMAFKIHSDDNIIRYNNLSDNKEWGIMLGPGPTVGNVIEYNTISRSTGPGYWYGGTGLVLQNAYFNKIKKNNIMDNRVDVYLNSSIGNIWLRNYWDNYSGFGPKIIFGKLAFPWNPNRAMPWINIDWRPAKEPYDI